MGHLLLFEEQVLFLLMEFMLIYREYGPTVMMYVAALDS